MTAEQEAAITCAACTPGHGTRLVRPCNTHGCECFCNRSTTPPHPGRGLVTFAAALRSEDAECISHITDDGIRTRCGRLVATAAAVEHGIDNEEPDCKTCRGRKP